MNEETPRLMKVGLTARLGGVFSFMTLVGMGGTWLLAAFGAGSPWFGGLVMAALAFPFGIWVGRWLLKSVHDADAHAARLLQGWRAPGSDDDEREWNGLNKTLAYVTAHSPSRIQTLESERAKGTAILDSMTEGVIVLDGPGRVILMNPAARKILDLAQDQGEGRTLLEVVRNRGLADWVEMCQSLDTGGTVPARDRMLFAFLENHCGECQAHCLFIGAPGIVTRPARHHRTPTVGKSPAPNSLPTCPMSYARR